MTDQHERAQQEADSWFAPTREEWEYRREMYAYINGQVAHDGLTWNLEHVASLEKELQRLFCAGAWTAVVVFASAVVEGYLSSRDIKKRVRHEQRFRAAGLMDEWDWLRERRNTIVHLDPKSPGLSRNEYWYRRSDLERDARRAVSVALAVFFFETRPSVEDSEAAT